jgi:MFS transporter, PAT family, beta-lactamase induction signal transducer AmpG
MTKDPPDRPNRKSWRQTLAAVIDPRAVAMLFLGFSAGLPILLIFSTLSVWLREAGVQRASVTFFSWAALGYAFKFVWAPLIDRLPFPYLTALMGRRRSWLLASQLALVGAMLWTSAFDPQHALAMTAMGAILIGFSSATQDIVIDAFRIESAEQEMQSILSSMYIAGYRIGMIVAGAGSLWLADWWSQGYYDCAVWARVYRTMAAVMLVGIVTTLVIREPRAMSGRESSFENNGDYFRFLGLFVLAAGAFVAGFLVSAESGQALKTVLVENLGMMKRLAGFVTETARLVFSISLGGLVVWGLITARAVP